jgi:hypothetical protein
MTLEELVERIRQIGIAANPESPLLNSKVLIELVLPRVLNKLVSDAARDEYQLNALRADHSLAIASGVVSCPMTIKEEYADSIVFTSAPTTSYKPTHLDFSNGSTLFDSYRVGEGQIYYRQAATGAKAFTGTKTINAVTLPVLPALSSGDIDVGTTLNLKDDLIEQIITYTASLIKGEIPLQAIGLANNLTS